MINKSNIVHGVIALIFQLIIGILSGNWWYGAFLAAGLFWGREHDQKQHNIATATGRKVKDLQWYEGADMTKWHLDSIMDFTVPFVSTIAVALVMHFPK